MTGRRDRCLDVLTANHTRPVPSRLVRRTSFSRPAKHFKDFSPYPCRVSGGILRNYGTHARICRINRRKGKASRGRSLPPAWSAGPPFGARALRLIHLMNLSYCTCLRVAPQARRRPLLLRTLVAQSPGGGVAQLNEWTKQATHPFAARSLKMIHLIIQSPCNHSNRLRRKALHTSGIRTAKLSAQNLVSKYIAAQHVREYGGV